MGNIKGLIITIAVLILLVLGLGGFIVYDKVLNKKEEDNGYTTIDDVSINLNAFYQISDTLNRLDMAFNDPTSLYFGYIYQKKKLETKDFDLGAALFASVRSELKEVNLLLSVPQETIKGNFTQIFGDNLKYSLNEINAGDYYKFAYNGNTDNLDYIVAVGKTSYSPGYIALDTKTSLKDDKVLITRKIVYVDYTSSNGGAINTAVLYKTNAPESRLGSLVLKNGRINKKELLSKYASKLQTFTYTFQQKKDDDYSFISIEQSN